MRDSGNVTISWPVPTVTKGTNYLTVPALPAPPAAVRLFYRLRTP